MFNFKEQRKNKTWERKIHRTMKEFRTFSSRYKRTQQTTPLYRGVEVNQVFRCTLM